MLKEAYTHPLIGLSSTKWPISVAGGRACVAPGATFLSETPPCGSKKMWRCHSSCSGLRCYWLGMRGGSSRPSGTIKSQCFEWGDADLPQRNPPRGWHEVAKQQTFLRRMQRVSSLRHRSRRTAPFPIRHTHTKQSSWRQTEKQAQDGTCGVA